MAEEKKLRKSAGRKSSRKDADSRDVDPWRNYPCPTCGRTFDGSVSPYRQPKKLAGLPAWFWALMVVCLIIALLVSACWWTTSLLSDGGDERKIKRDVFIAQDGYHRILISDSYGDSVDVELHVTSVSGGSFDVYVMDEDDLSNAYSGRSSQSFSSLYSAENVREVDTEVEWDEEHGEVYLVIDNSDIALMNTDAVPTGPIQVHVNMEIEEEYGNWD